MFLSDAFAITGTTASTVGGMADNLTGQISSMEDILAYFSYFIGLSLGFKAVLKLKEHSEDPRSTKLITPIMLILAAGMFMSLPFFIGLGIHTFGFTSPNASGQSSGVNSQY